MKTTTILFGIILLLLVSCNVHKHYTTRNDLSKSSFYDFGLSKKDEILHTTFTLKNKFNYPIILYQVTTSCKCVQTELSKTRLNPNESTEMKVTFNTVGFKGLQKKSITIETNAPSHYVQFFVQTEIINENEDGVIINGVKWATRNVDIPGQFTENPEDLGMFYQWNRKFAWNSTDQNVTNWNGISSYGDYWKKDNDPSPIGWRVPTKDEIETLLDTNLVSQEWININGRYGKRFTDKATGNSIFLPATGDRYYSDGSLRTHDINDTTNYYGTYWSSSQFRADHAYDLWFNNKGSGWHNNHLKYGRSIRPVIDSEDAMKQSYETFEVDECFDEFISYFMTNGKFQIVRCGVIDEESILKLFESDFINYTYYFSNSFEKNENCEEDISNEKYLSILNTTENKKIILSFKKIDGRWFLTNRKDLDFDYSNIENFETFFYRFSTDSSFRNKHINYPLKYSDLDSDYEIKTDYLTSENELQFDFFETNEFRYFYDNDFDYTKRVLIWLKGLENGISSYFYFEKFNDGWKLVEYENYSM